jgi:hypothetical protein
MSCVRYHCYVRELYINSMESAAWHIILLRVVVQFIIMGGSVLMCDEYRNITM